MSCSDFFLALLALLFPPLAVWVKRGICSADSVINILLCMLGYVPGLIHAWYIIVKFPESPYVYDTIVEDPEDGSSSRVTYVVVSPASAAATRSHHHHNTAKAPAQPQQALNYGTTSSAAGPPASAAGPSSAPAPAAAAAATNDNGGEGRSDAAPPSYAQVVAGDNKIQSQD